MEIQLTKEEVELIRIKREEALLEEQRKDVKKRQAIQENILREQKKSEDWVRNWNNQNSATKVYASTDTDFEVVEEKVEHVYTYSEYIYAEDENGRELNDIYGKLTYATLLVNAVELKLKRKGISTKNVVVKIVVHEVREDVGRYSSRLKSANYEMQLHGDLFPWDESKKWYKKLSTVKRVIDEKVESVKNKRDSEQAKISLNVDAERFVKELYSEAEVKADKVWVASTKYHGSYERDIIKVIFPNKLIAQFTATRNEDGIVKLHNYSLDTSKFDIVDVVNTLRKM